jgi:hypothetical protein
MRDESQRSDIHPQRIKIVGREAQELNNRAMIVEGRHDLFEMAALRAVQAAG